MAPIKSVVRPECNQEDVDHRLLMEPMTTKTIAVNANEIENEYGVSNK
jgi:hypothetical protein